MQTQTQTVAYKLIFSKVIQLGVEYLFPGSGDEDTALGRQGLFMILVSEFTCTAQCLTYLENTF
jgi:hypothetical protein